MAVSSQRGWIAQLVLLTLAVPFAVACSCIPEATGPTCGTIEHYDTVFLGRVASRLPLFAGDDRSGMYFYVFEVLETFRGKVAPRQLLLVDPDVSTTCGSGFDRDAVYLIKANRWATDWRQSFWDREGNRGASSALMSAVASPDVYATGQCSGNLRADAAERDIRQLRGWRAHLTQTSLYGLASLQRRSYFQRHPNPEVVAGARIRLTTSSGVVETVSASDGSFEIPAVPPGRYRVDAVLPPYRVDAGMQTVRIPKTGCGFYAPTFVADAYIEGLLLHHDGTPARGVPVEALWKTSDGELHWDSDWMAVTDDSGQFRIGPLANGTHLLAANYQKPPTPERPFPRTFYPGVEKDSAATAITLDGTERRRGLVWFLPPPSPIRRVRFEVYWPDGRPATFADVRAHVHDFFAIAADTDSRGVVTVPLLEKVDYDIEGWRFGGWGQPLPRRYREAWGVHTKGKLPAATGDVRMRLVLDRPEWNLEPNWWTVELPEPALP
jgi:hypothetical protein